MWIQNGVWEARLHIPCLEAVVATGVLVLDPEPDHIREGERT